MSERTYTEARTRLEKISGALGGDPGSGNGFFLAAWDRCTPRRPLLTRAWVVNPDGAAELLRWVLSEYGSLIGAAGLEAYDNRRRSAMTRRWSAGEMHSRISVLAAVISDAGIPVTVRPPALVKPWATDKRLEAAGMMSATAGMPDHARDAARHCLYTARHDLDLRDPLSRRRAGDAQGTGSG